MRLSRRLVPFVVAIGMFAVALLLGAGARAGGRIWSGAPAAGQSALVVAVRSGARGMRVENLTETSWAGCVVTIEGGVSSEPFTFPSNGVTRLGYWSFRAGSTPMAGTEAFTRAFHRTSMMCRDADGHWQAAAFR